MTGATVQVRGTNETYEVNFYELPRVGEVIIWRSYDDVPHFSGRVTEVKHLVYGTMPEELPSHRQGLAELPWGSQRVIIEVEKP